MWMFSKDIASKWCVLNPSIDFEQIWWLLLIFQSKSCKENAVSSWNIQEMNASHRHSSIFTHSMSNFTQAYCIFTQVNSIISRISPTCSTLHPALRAFRAPTLCHVPSELHPHPRLHPQLLDADRMCHLAGFFDLLSKSYHHCKVLAGQCSFN